MVSMPGSGLGLVHGNGTRKWVFRAAARALRVLRPYWLDDQSLMQSERVSGGRLALPSDRDLEGKTVDYFVVWHRRLPATDAARR